MNRTKFLKGDCQNCGGRLEFPADQIGSNAECPFCHQQTELMLAALPKEPALPRRVIIWTAVALCVLMLGLAGAIVALKRVQRWSARHRPPGLTRTELTNAPSTQASNEATPTNSTIQNDFVVNKIALVKTAGSSLVFATGTAKNTANRQRFGVKVELILADAAGQKVGTASDYRAVLEPEAEWAFKALVLDDRTATVSLGSIKETQ